MVRQKNKSITQRELIAWNLPGCEVRWQLVEQSDSRVADLAFRPDGQVFATKCTGDIDLWSAEGQQLFESMGRVPASTRVKSALNNFPFTLVEPSTVLEEAEKWEKIWGDFFLKQ